MKHVVIGDLHGRDAWKKVNIDNFEKVVFMGDYVDSLRRSDLIIRTNFKQVIFLKKRHPEKVVLLLGNHDVQYLHYPNYFCPGFRPQGQAALTELFTENRKLFQMAYQRGHYLFTHAGVTFAWYKRFMGSSIVQKIRQPEDRLADLINKVEQTDECDILYSPSRYRTGEDSDGGILWADHQELGEGVLKNYHQIVGHNPVPEVTKYIIPGDPNTTITLVDVLHRKHEFYDLDI
jgi:hypothetical protein